ncbi:OmpA family protein [bacterium]|nr:OmpA family protein [bacterium]
MAEDTEQQKTEVGATPSSNQNLILGIVMGAVVLLLLLLVITQQFNKSGGHQEDSEVAELRKNLEEQKQKSEQLRIAGIPGVTGDPQALVAQIKNDTEALARLVNSSASDAAALAAANADLRNERDQYQVDAARAADLQRQLEQARSASAGKVSQSEYDRLRAELDTAKAESGRLRTQMAEMQNKNQGMIDANTYALLKAQLDDSIAEIARLRAENQRLMTELAGAKLFVTQDDLSPRAVALYRALKKIETEDHRARRDTYATFSEQIKANVRESINFKTGSTQIALEHEAHIEDMVKSADPNSFFLVVGYASTSGDSKNNEELSSRRATRVASMVNYHKGKDHEVQAIYLGEGKRFGPEDSPNQVCEVWEIRP